MSKIPMPSFCLFAFLVLSIQAPAMAGKLLDAEGPAAFVETAADFADFAEAIKRKLAREIRRQGLVRLGPFEID